MAFNRRKYGGGRRPYPLDPTILVASKWEKNVLLWLDFIKIKFLYEPQRFYFAEGTRGSQSYLPDLYLPQYKATKKNCLPDLGLTDCWLEVKGFMDSKSHMILTHFIRDYPEEAAKLVAITFNVNAASTKYYKKKGIPILCYYQDLDRKYKNIIPHWEE